MESQKIEDQSLQAAGVYLVSLIRKALIDELHNEELKDCTWEQVYKLATRNSVEAVSFYGLNKELVPKDLFKKWQEQANVTLYRQISFDAEREKILKEFENAGISYVPLKGINLVNLYPKPGMRAMADNDILYKYMDKPNSEKEAQMAVCEIMKKLGYEVKSLEGNHDCYMKQPCYNFEMHRELMHSSNPLYFHYKNIWDKAIKCENSSFKYQFSDSDEYVYLVAHTYKHFSNYGCGIRSIVDQHVYLSKKEKDLDWDYINAELETLGIKDFEEQLKKLSVNALEKGVLDSEDYNMLYYMLGCGTYGYFDNYVNNALNRVKSENGKAYKINYICQRLFLSREKCKTYYPFFYKNYWLIWLLPGYRLIRGLILRPKHIWKELMSVFKHR